jgi:hypothetical protein
MTPVPIADDAAHAAHSVGPFYGCASDACRHSGYAALVLTSARFGPLYSARDQAFAAHSTALSAGRAELYDVPGGTAVSYSFWRPLGSMAD